jgi:hypothetical protein
MIFLLCNRQKILELLPKHKRWAEIGVLRGDGAQRLLDVVAPSELHLIDPWKWDLDFDWFAPPAQSRQFREAAKFVTDFSRAFGLGPGEHINDRLESIYRGVCDRFRHESRVKIHRARSSDAAASFPDGYFDYVYIDGAHNYEGVLSDLTLYDRKLTEGGALLGDDYCEHGIYENSDYGVIGAVTKFRKRSSERLFILNSEKFGFFGLFPSNCTSTTEFMQRLTDSSLVYIEISDSLAANYHLKMSRSSAGRMRFVPTF